MFEQMADYVACDNSFLHCVNVMAFPYFGGGACLILSFFSASEGWLW
jgi:hypothetical protein